MKNSMSQPEVVTLDLWGTLIQEAPNMNPEIKRHRIIGMRDELRRAGREYDIPRIENAYRSSGDYCQRVWAENRDLQLEEHFIAMLSTIDKEFPESLGEEILARLRTIYSEALLHHPPVLIGDTEDALKELSNRGFRLGLISNTGRTPGAILRQLIERLGIEHYFESMTFSDEVGVRKPDERIFLHALGEFGASPERAAHVGDDPEADYEGARHVGMRAILVDRSAGGKNSRETVGSLLDLGDIL